MQNLLPHTEKNFLVINKQAHAGDNRFLKKTGNFFTETIENNRKHGGGGAETIVRGFNTGVFWPGELALGHFSNVFYGCKAVH